MIMKAILLQRLGETAVQLQEADRLVRLNKANGDKKARHTAELSQHMLRGYQAGLRYALEASAK